jgi:hypothetical protein
MTEGIAMKRPALFFLIALLVTSSAFSYNGEKAGARYRRFSIHLGYNKGFATQNESVSWSREIYYENATYGVAYQAKEGNSFSVSLGYKFSRSVGVELGGDFVSRDLGSSYNASIPHPLLFGAARAAEGKASSQVGENSFFLNLVLSVPFSQFGMDIYAGPAYFNASADVINGIQYSQSYPYSSITITAQNEKISKKVMGFNAGLRLMFNFSQNVGIFASGTYFSGTAEFKPGDVPGLKLTLGGFKAGGGLVVSF